MTEDEMVGWHYQLNGQQFGQTLEVGFGQGGLACCSSRGRKELNMTEQLKCTELMDLTFQVPVQYCSLQHQTLSIGLYFHHQSHPQLGVVFALTLSLYLFIYLFWSYFSVLQQHTGYLLTWGVHLSVSYLFAFSYSSWGSLGKNTEPLSKCKLKHQLLHIYQNGYKKDTDNTQCW